MSEWQVVFSSANNILTVEKLDSPCFKERLHLKLSMAPRETELGGLGLENGDQMIRTIKNVTRIPTESF